MGYDLIIIIAILIMIVIVFVLAIPAFKLRQKEFERTGKHPKGYYMSQGIAIGLPIGIPIGLALGNIAFGPAIGVAIGTAMGAVWEKKHAHELRPMTEAEKKIKKRALILSSIALIVGIILFFFIYMAQTGHSFIF